MCMLLYYMSHYCSGHSRVSATALAVLGAVYCCAVAERLLQLLSMVLIVSRSIIMVGCNNVNLMRHKRLYYSITYSTLPVLACDMYS